MARQNQFSLYVHIPFCVKKCLFCSFAVTIGQAHRVDEYLEALTKEAQQHKGRVIKTVYLGGGTPTFINAKQLAQLVGDLRRNFKIMDDAEWAIEINPEDIDAAKARTLKELGFTRVSLGVQSFNDAYLKFLGRAHDSAQALRAFEILRAAGFKNISVDVMYGFPKQTRAELAADLNAALDLHSEHISLYTLTIEPNSRFYATQMKLDSDEKLADDFSFVSDTLEQAGLKQYEVSNFAKLGFESRHNMGYWTGVEYIGLGMGAHSFVDGRRFWNTEHLKEYLEKTGAGASPMAGEEALSLRTRFMERLVFGLRTNKGVYVPIIEKEVSFMLPQETGDLIEHLIEGGFLCRQDGYLKATRQGQLILDDLATRLI